MKKNECLLIGVKRIINRFEITTEQFYMFLKLGMPVRKINGRWYGHEKNIERFLEQVTIGKPIEVSTSGLPAEAFEEKSS